VVIVSQTQHHQNHHHRLFVQLLPSSSLDERNKKSMSPTADGSQRDRDSGKFGPDLVPLLD
jgi:hypothetical protein